MQFDQAQIDSIARALGDTEDGLTGSEIGHLLSVCRMARHDPGSAVTKWKRIQNAFAMDQSARGNRTAILEFIRQSMRPALHLTDPDRHEKMRFKLNRALALTGLSVDQAGLLGTVEASRTVGEAESRTRALRAGLERRGVHPDVLEFCQAEWLVDDHFHAVQEAVKSIMAKLRAKTGLTWDGADLVNPALGGNAPLLAINPRETKSQRDEQKVFLLIPDFHPAMRFW